VPSGHDVAGAYDRQQAPERIIRKAAAHDLGALVIAQRGSNPIANALFAAAVVAVLCLLIWGMAWAGQAYDLGFLRPLIILAVVGVVVGTIMMVMSLIAGFTSAYLFDNGVICTRNGIVSVARWQDVDRLLLWRAGGRTALRGKLLCYYVVTGNGRRMPIEARQGDQGDPLGEALQATMARMGRPVVESGPAAGVLRPKNG
jgi:hypothetical protein